MPPDAYFLYLQLGDGLRSYGRTSKVFCLGFGNDHRHQHSTIDVLLTTRRLFMLSIAKVADQRSFLSIGNVTFLHIPSSSCFFLSGFLSSLYECSITANQHSPCPRNTQLPCQVIAKKRVHIWLPSILLHMPSKGFRLSPIKVLIPTVSGASTPPHVMD